MESMTYVNIKMYNSSNLFEAGMAMNQWELLVENRIETPVETAYRNSRESYGLKEESQCRLPEVMAIDKWRNNPQVDRYVLTT